MEKRKEKIFHREKILISKLSVDLQEAKESRRVFFSV